MEDAPHPYCSCLFFTANALARTVTRLTEEAFTPTGLAPSLAFVMMTVGREPGIQPSGIAALLRLSPSTVTRLVEKLEARGLIRRSAEGKAVHVLPTAEGEALLPRLAEARSLAHVRIADRLGGDTARVLTEHLHTAALTLDGSTG